MSRGILSDLRVIEGSAFVAAPLGGMTLAQLGAEVIRVDPIGGGLDYRRWPVDSGDHSLFWAGLNKGKKSVALDIANPRGQELFTGLITAPGENSGLFISNFPARGWLSYEKLAALRRDLVYVNVTGDRTGGSEVDYTVNPRIGMPWITGHPDDSRPVNHVLPAWDCTTGTLVAVALLAAERQRRLTGRGEYIGIALLDVALAMLGNLGFIGEHDVNGRSRQRHGNDLFGAFGRDFVTCDGRRLMVIALTERQWASLQKATGLGPQLAEAAEDLGLDFRHEGDRFAGRNAIAGLMASWISARDYQSVTTTFKESGVCFGPYQTLSELLETDSEASLANPLFTLQDQPGIGSYRMPSSPLSFMHASRVDAKPAPRLGQHTDEVLADWLGLSNAQIGVLHDAGIAAGPEART